MSGIKGDELFEAIKEIAKKEGISDVRISIDKSTVVLEDGRTVELAIRSHCGTNGIEIRVLQGEEFFTKLTGKESIISAFEKITDLLES